MIKQCKEKLRKRRASRPFRGFSASKIASKESGGAISRSHGLSVLLLNVQVYWLNMNEYLANFISIVLVSLWNFFMNVKFGWNALVPGR